MDVIIGLFLGDLVVKVENEDLYNVINDFMKKLEV